MSAIVCNPQDRLWLQQLVGTADGLMALQPDKVAAISLSTETFAVNLDPAALPNAPGQIFVKRYRYRSWKAVLAGCFRGTIFGRSRARLEFEVLSEMHRRGVRVVRPIAYAEQRRLGILRGCVLVTEAERDTETLSSYCLSHLSTWKPGTCRGFVREIGKIVANMHEVGVRHGGLFWRNILVADRAEGQWTFTLLDPNRRFSLHAGAIPSPAMVSDLSDFIASAVSFWKLTDIARFLRSYQQSRPSLGKSKTLAREIVRLASRKAVHESRRCVMETAFAWLQQRIQHCAAASNRVAFDSLAAFIAAIEGADQLNGDKSSCVIRLKMSERDASGKKQMHDIVFDRGRVHVERGTRERFDLLIRADADALLAIINGRPDVLKAIQSGRVQLRGNVQHLALLAQLIDSQAVSTSRAVVGEETSV